MEIALTGQARVGPSLTACPITVNRTGTHADGEMRMADVTPVPRKRPRGVGQRLEAPIPKLMEVFVGDWASLPKAGIQERAC